MTTMISVLVAAAFSAQSFRAEHVEVKAGLAHVADLTGALGKQRNPRPRAAQVLAFFEEHIAPHAAEEEAGFYPLVDSVAGPPATATMRHEHRVVGRWIHLLQAHLAAGDWPAFERRADNLIGLLSAHFEEEEEVLLPYVADSPSTRR